MAESNGPGCDRKGLEGVVPNIQRDRVAQVIVETGDPRQNRRGSGYRVTSETVLTAAHVVADAVALRVRFNADTPEAWEAPATVAFADRHVDVAALTLPVLRSADKVAPVSFGRVGDKAAVIPCAAVGFPLFKLKQHPPSADGGMRPMYRDTVHVEGRISSLSNWREGTLEVRVDPPEADPDPERSPWEGMSGAALWSQGRIIGLVARHHRREGLNRLAALRTDRWYSQLAPDGLARLSALTGLPAQPTDLVDVIPSESVEALVATSQRPAPVDSGRRVVGVRPVGALEIWYDRDEIRLRLAELLKSNQRVTSVIGRRGVGKSGVVTRVLADYEDNYSGTTSGIDGIVYLSTRTGLGEMTLTHIFRNVSELLSEPEQVRLMNRWVTVGKDAFGDLFDALQPRRVVVVLDNLDDVQDPATDELQSPDVYSFLLMTCLAPRAPSVVTTSQRTFPLPIEVRQHVVVLELRDGLAPEFAVSLLRDLDSDGRAGIQALDEKSLQSLAARVGGIPRGLQLLVGYLQDHQVSGVRRLLRSDSAPQAVLRELVSIAYDRLSGLPLEIVNIIAVAGVPLPGTAFAMMAGITPDDYGLEDALDNLVSRREVAFDDDNMFRLHPLDADHVLSKLTEVQRMDLDLRLARWYASLVTDREGWRVLADADPVKKQYQHLWRAGRQADALDILGSAAEFLARHGDAAALKSAVAVAEQEGFANSRSTHVCRGFAEFFSGSTKGAVDHFARASQLADRAPEWELWTGVALRQSGRAEESKRVLSSVISDGRATREVRVEAALELGLSCCYTRDLDGAANAISLLEAQRAEEDSPRLRAYVGDVLALERLLARRLSEAIAAADDGIANYADSPVADAAGYVRNVRGLALLLLGRSTEAADDFAAVAAEASSLGQDRLEGIARTNLAWAFLLLGAFGPARAAARQAADRLKSVGMSTVSSAIADTLSGTVSVSDAEALLTRAAEGSRSNPDFYHPTVPEVSALASTLAAADLSGS